MTARSVQDWFQIIQREKHDSKLAEQLLLNLMGYHPGYWNPEDQQQLVTLFTALRLDQMAKENHHGT